MGKIEEKGIVQRCIHIYTIVIIDIIETLTNMSLHSEWRKEDKFNK